MRVSFVKYILVILLLGAAAAASVFFSGRNKSEYTAPVPSVYVAFPERRTISETVSFGAHIEARAMIPVVPLVSGTITEYPARAGDYVNQGTLLALIDEEPLRQQMLQAKAAYTGYESSFSRVAGLYRAGAATRQEYESLQSQRDAARAQYELAQLQLGYAKVTAPVSGTILSAPLAVGNIGNSQQPVAVIADLDDLVIRLSVPEKYFSLFVTNRENLMARIIKDNESSGDVSNREECNASVDTIAPYVDARTKTFETVFQLIDAPETFKPGMYVRIEITFMQHRNALTLPVNVRKTDGSCYMFVPENGESKESVHKTLTKNDAVSGQAQHVSFKEIITDGKWFVVPNEYANNFFIVEGQGSVFNGQPVSATAFVTLSDTVGE